MRLQDLDDDAPPRARPGTLSEVRDRGRSLRRRRQSLRLAGVTLIVVALAAGAVAVARTDHHQAGVEVQPTTTPGPPMVYERYADVGALHYSLLLHTPVVTPGATVRLELIVENRTRHDIHIVDCGLGPVRIVTARGFGRGNRRILCHGPESTLAAGGVIDDEREGAAPTAPGRYIVTDLNSAQLPAALDAPLDLQVVAPTGPPPTCSTEVSLSVHRQLAAPAGIVSLPGLTDVGSDPGDVAPFKTLSEPPGPKCSYTVVGGIGQFWLSTAAITHYGSATKVPLPIPIGIASRHPGPVQVSVTVLEFGDDTSAPALLNNPSYNSNAGWTRLPDVSIPGGFVIKDYSAANDGLTGFIVQRVVGRSWIEVSAVGVDLTATETVQLAESVVVPSS